MTSRWSLVWMLWCAPLAARAQPMASPGVEQGDSFYRYKSAKGRITYTNAAEQVPLDQRAAAPVDLSRVTLNTEIGIEIERRLQEEHAALTRSPFCKRLRDAAAAPMLEQLWQGYAPLLVAAGVLLLLLVVSPAAMRRFGISGWSKAIGLAIPVVCATGLFVFCLDRARAAKADSLARAEPCMPDALSALGNEPGALQKHSELVARLKRDMAAIDAEGARQR